MWDPVALLFLTPFLSCWNALRISRDRSMSCSDLRISFLQSLMSSLNSFSMVAE